jgi:V/A-type H+-transporting ATPase subunit I
MGVQVCKQISIEISKKNRLDLAKLLMTRQDFEVVAPAESIAVEDSFVQRKQELQETADHLEHVLDYYKFHQIFTPQSNPIFETRTKISRSKFSELNDSLVDFQLDIQEISNKIRSLKDLEHTQDQLQDIIYKTEPLKDIELEVFGDYAYLRCVAFRVEEDRADHVVEEIENTFDDIEIESIKKIDKDYVYLVATHKDIFSKVQDFIANLATIIHFEMPELDGSSFYDIYASASKRLETMAKDISDTRKDIQNPSIKPEKMLIFRDVILSQIRLLDTLHSFVPQGKKVSIQGYINPSHLSELELALTDSNISHVITVSESSNSQKIQVVNNEFVSNFDIVTKLMGAPLATSIDPTPVLTVFFIGMFGLALSEAGYGLVLLLITGYFLASGRVKPSAEKLISVLFYSSISVLIIGALFGSWFGLVPDNVVEASLPHVEVLQSLGIISLLQVFQVINPMNIVLQFMIATVVLGVVHLSIGNILGFIQAMKQDKVLDGILDSLSWIGLIIMAIVLAITGASTPIIYATLIYVLVMILAIGRTAGSNPLIMFAKGAFDMFFGLIGYLSDSLSYTRLVALGLATGIIANVINTLAVLAGAGLVERGGIFFVIGYAIMAIIFVFGHAFNIILNIVGTYINVGRLHFVEFFGKFYESGGAELQPLAPSQEYIIVE